MRGTRRAVSIVASLTLVMAAFAPGMAFAEGGDPGDKGKDIAADASEDAKADDERDSADEKRNDKGDDKRDGADEKRQDGDKPVDPDEKRNDKGDDKRQDGEHRQDGEVGVDDRDYTDNPAVDENGKVWVCKYVGQPGVDERLKDGKNPIRVSWNTLQPNIVSSADEVTIGMSWTDAHDGSHVVVIEPGTDCPAPAAPEDPAYSIVFTKTWTGDTTGFDLGDDHVTFTIDGTDTIGVGDAHTVTPGTQLTFVENFDDTVLGDCTYQTDLPTSWPVPAADQFVDGVYTIAVTNNITCPQPDVLSIVFTKTWTGDTTGFDLGDDHVTFTIGGTDTIGVGDAHTVTPGTQLTFVENFDDTVLGDCTYQTDLPTSWPVPPPTSSSTASTPSPSPTTSPAPPFLSVPTSRSLAPPDLPGLLVSPALPALPVSPAPLALPALPAPLALPALPALLVSPALPALPALNRPSCCPSIWSSRS
jgi:hypothetical protein